MLTRVAQIVTVAHRDLKSCMHRPTSESMIAHQKLGQSDLLYGSKLKIVDVNKHLQAR